jgi:hypothetical protein
MFLDPSHENVGALLERSACSTTDPLRAAARPQRLTVDGAAVRS